MISERPVHPRKTHGIVGQSLSLSPVLSEKIEIKNTIVYGSSLAYYPYIKITSKERFLHFKCLGGENQKKTNIL